MSVVYIGIGANLIPYGYETLVDGLDAAVDMLQTFGLKIDTRSRWYVSTPVPVSDQPDFLNAVIKINTDLSAPEILDILHQIEQSFGRTRTVKNAARVLDLDILGYDQDVITTDSLIIPHPRMADRQFVIFPFADIDANWVHPRLNKTIAELKLALEQDEDSTQHCTPL